MKNFKLFFWVMASMLLLTACPNKNDEPDDTKNTITDTATYIVNEWIDDILREVYYWEDEIPSSLTPDDKTDPMDFFEEYRNTEDKWSWLTDDYDGLTSELSGTPVSMGISPYFVRIGSENVGIVVEYVYPDSPADKGGIKRGDVITKIDGEALTIDDYYDKYSQTSYTVSLAYLKDNTIYQTDKTVSLTAEVIEADPLIHSEILHQSGKKIGYAVYTGFISGSSDEYLESLTTTLKAFVDSNIDDLVLDFRYNPGGEVYMAQQLSSLLAPADVAASEKLLVKYDYNDLYENYFKKNAPEELYVNFVNTTNNLNLDKVYFLTAAYTASASELTIIGLRPYMDVVQIGEYTYGKYTGMWVIPDTESPRRHNYAMLPIVFKYENSVGYGNFANGLTPDYEVDDDGLFAGIPFGDVSDPILGKAVELITGTAIASARKAPIQHQYFESILPKEKEMMMNAIVTNKLK